MPQRDEKLAFDRQLMYVILLTGRVGLHLVPASTLLDSSAILHLSVVLPFSEQL